MSRSTLQLVLRVRSRCALLALATPAHAVSRYTLLGWNDLGLHCSDPDYQAFALQPPANTIEAQLIDPDGRLVAATNGLTVTYEAVADPDGSITATSVGKTNFWAFVDALFGVMPADDVGLAGSAMPGAANVPQPMAFRRRRAGSSPRAYPSRRTTTAAASIPIR